MGGGDIHVSHVQGGGGAARNLVLCLVLEGGGINHVLGKFKSIYWGWGWGMI